MGVKILRFGRCALTICAATAMLADGGGGSSYVDPSAEKSESWQGWKTATGNGLVGLRW
jgi:hypothetical protein